MLEELKREVCWANQQLPKLHLVAWTSGNVCGRDPKTGLVVVKPSGVLFDDLRPEIMPVVDLDGKQVEARLIADGSFDAICDRARHVETSANLLTKSERKALHEALELPACQKLFSLGLADLLYGTESEETRFKHFLRTLGILELNKWPFATLFSFIRHPQQSAFIKPSAIQNAAKALCWRINYKAEPNWKTYDAVARLYSYVRTNLLEEGLMPRDLIDVQAFVWSVAQK